MRKLERIKAVEPAEMVSILARVKSLGLRVISYGEGQQYPTKEHAFRSNEFTSFSACVLIGETITNLEITTTYYVNNKQTLMYPTTWVCSLNEEKPTTVTGQKAYMQFQRAAKIPSLKTLGVSEELFKSPSTGRYQYSAIPMLGSKSPFLSVYSNVYEYDRNSAYASVLLAKMPNFAYLDRDRVVREGEIGWLLTENLVLRFEGEYADFISPLVDTPIAVKNYIAKWYAEKLKGNKEAKAMLNFPIGYYQRTNPFFRAYVVNSCNNIIKPLIDDNVVLWNTDAIYTLKHVDLPLSNKIGEWKLTQINKLTVDGCNYQIDNDLPKYRGIPKQWFISFEQIHGRAFDLEKDELPERINKWRFNWKLLKLEEYK